jgi:hypothetical protein
MITHERLPGTLSVKVKQLKHKSGHLHPFSGV